MKKAGLFILCLFVFLCLKAQNSKDAQKYNICITNQHDIIVEKENGLIKMIDRHITPKLDSTYSDFITQVNSSINYISSLTPFNGETYLKESAIAFFNVYKSVAENEYVEILKIAKIREKDLRPEEKKKFNKLTKQVKKKINKGMTPYIKAQIKFSKTYKFNLM